MQPEAKSRTLSNQLLQCIQSFRAGTIVKANKACARHVLHLHSFKVTGDPMGPRDMSRQKTRVWLVGTVSSFRVRALLSMPSMARGLLLDGSSFSGRLVRVRVIVLGRRLEGSNRLDGIQAGVGTVAQ